MASKVVAVRVTENDKTILDWYALKVGPKESFASLFETIVEASLNSTSGARFKQPIELKETTYSKCECHTENGHIEVGWGLGVIETLESFGSARVSFLLKPKQSDVNENPKNAFSELFLAQRQQKEKELKYPSTIGQNVDNVTRGDWRLKNDMISLMKENEMGFTSGEDTVGKTVVNGLSFFAD